jgi:hypothetical protein
MTGESAVVLTYVTFIGLYETGKEALAEIAGSTGEVVKTRGNGVIPAIESKLDDITLLGLNGIGVERIISGGDSDGLCLCQGQQGCSREDGLEGRHDVQLCRWRMIRKMASWKKRM